MRFEVIDRDGKIKMSTEHRSCIYPADTLKRMETAGYKFRVNGKRWKPGQEIKDDLPKAAPFNTRSRKRITSD
jgi:hypothetical protein